MQDPVPDRAEDDGRSLTLIAFERLRADLIQGDLRPGQRLRVQALSSRYGTGATAIREALSRLLSDGMVQFEDQRGFLATPVSRADLLDLTDARVGLECLALTHAIERGDVAWEAELLASSHRLAMAPPPLSAAAALVWSAAHRVFHEALLAGCGSHWLRTLCRLLYDKSERYRHLANLHGPLGPLGSAYRQDDHVRMMQAALDRDPVAATGLLASHYRQTTQIVLDAPDMRDLFDDEAARRGQPNAGATIRRHRQ